MQAMENGILQGPSVGGEMRNNEADGKINSPAPS